MKSVHASEAWASATDSSIERLGVFLGVGHPFVHRYAPAIEPATHRHGQPGIGRSALILGDRPLEEVIASRPFCVLVPGVSALVGHRAAMLFV
jgi:hypothetical protein